MADSFFQNFDGISEKMIATVSAIDIPFLNTVSVQFEKAARGFLIDTAKQGALVAKVDSALSQGSPNTRGFPLLNPYDVVLIAIGYLLIVAFGRLIMTMFNPLPVRLIQIVHNTVLMCLSAYMVLETINQAFVQNSYKIFGNDLDNTSKGLGMARIVWIFYASKVLEFIDTFIMVARKADRQISFLHLYHHFTIFLIWFAASVWGPGADAYFCVILNSGVHVIMYGYYLSSSLKVPLTFIRPYITMIQMSQFFLMLLNATYNLIYPSSTYPYNLYILLWVYMISLLALFYNFFRKSYKSKKPSNKKKTN